MIKYFSRRPIYRFTLDRDWQASGGSSSERIADPDDPTKFKFRPIRARLGPPRTFFGDALNDLIKAGVEIHLYEDHQGRWHYECQEPYGIAPAMDTDLCMMRGLPRYILETSPPWLNLPASQIHWQS